MGPAELRIKYAEEFGLDEGGNQWKITERMAGLEVQLRKIVPVALRGITVSGAGGRGISEVTVVLIQVRGTQGSEPASSDRVTGRWTSERFCS